MNPQPGFPFHTLSLVITTSHYQIQQLQIMKTLSIVLSFLLIFASVFTATAQNDKTKLKETIPVSGECGMCKKTIEKAAIGAGATTATWSEKKKKLTVVYNTDKTSSQKIQEAIAAAGYETRDFAANTAAYNELDECCKYERKKGTDAPATPAKPSHH